MNQTSSYFLAFVSGFLLIEISVPWNCFCNGCWSIMEKIRKKIHTAN